jgi:hypothetical protein
VAPGGVDLGAGLVVLAARAAAPALGVATLPMRAARRVPVLGPRIERTALRATAEGRRLRARGRTELEAAVDAMLAAPETERALDLALAGPLMEALGRSVAQHRVVERLASEIVARGAADEALTAALEHEATQRLLERALASPAVERMLVTVLESRLVPELTERLLRSPELDLLLQHVAASPELRRALTDQSTSLAQEMAGGLRSRTENMDDAVERTLRGWLRRPRPTPG